jgi:hypothetical protein
MTREARVSQGGPTFATSERVYERTRIWASLTVAVLLLGLGWMFVVGRDAPLPGAGVARADEAGPGFDATPGLKDPLAPARPPALDATRTLPNEWVRARPAEEFQYSLDSSKRGGVEPCGTPAPIEARKLQTPLGKGQLYVPADALAGDGRFDLVIHLHGGDPILREAAASSERFVVYMHTLGLDQSYAALFSGPALFPTLVEQIESAVGARQGRSGAAARHIAVSAWSAGFEGVRALLYQPEDPRFDAVVLIDGLHAPRQADVFSKRMTPFVEFARRAARGEKFMTITHSSIPTEAYASTTETAHHLVAELGEKPLTVRRDDEFGLTLVEFFSRGNLHVRGYAGNDKADHCAQIFTLRSTLQALSKRWATLR